MTKLNLVLVIIAAIAAAFVLRGEATSLPQNGQRITNGACKSAKEWKERSIYFLLTDRFAITPGSQVGGCESTKYCGGTFKGITSKLDYIKGMGFDAIWISPIMEQVPPDGGKYEPYHGYHAKDWFKINPRFGSEEDFTELLYEADKKGIWVMLDLALNHMGGTIENIGSYNPFNNKEDYHGCKPCDSCSPCAGNCGIDSYDVNGCALKSPQVEYCRLASLPDLDQTKEKVQQQTTKLFKEYLPKFNINGYRLDAIKHMPPWYLKQFVTDQTDCFTIGEALFQKPMGESCVQASYQKSGAVDGLLDFNMQGALTWVFRDRSVASMKFLEETFLQNTPNYLDASVNGLFIDNHDSAANQCRWLGIKRDENPFRNALSYVFTGLGIPILYYGTEQGFFNSGDDAECRKPLWTTVDKDGRDVSLSSAAYDENFKYYKLVKQLNSIRKACKIWKYSQDGVSSGENHYIFRRGDLYTILTNSRDDRLPIRVYVALLPAGTKMCNAFFPPEKDGSGGDCVTVTSDRYFDTVLRGGEPKIFVPVGVSASTCGADPFGTSTGMEAAMADV